MKKLMKDVLSIHISVRMNARILQNHVMGNAFQPEDLSFVMEYAVQGSLKIIRNKGYYTIHAAPSSPKG